MRLRGDCGDVDRFLRRQGTELFDIVEIWHYPATSLMRLTIRHSPINSNTESSS